MFNKKYKVVFDSHLQKNLMVVVVNDKVPVTYAWWVRKNVLDR